MYSESQQSLPVGAEVLVPLLHSQTFLIRRAKSLDVAALHQFECSSFDPEMAFNQRQIKSLIQNSRADYWLLEMGGCILAQLIILQRQRGSRQVARIYSLTVAHDFRGKGLARQILNWGLEVLQAKGIRDVSLEVEANAIAPLNLYHSLGFHEEKRLPSYYGHCRDGIRMIKKLEFQISNPI